MGVAIQRSDGTYSAWARYQEPRPLLEGECYVVMAEPPVVTTSGPDVPGFKAALKTGLGQAAIRGLMKNFPEALPAVEVGNWAWFQQAVIDAKAAGDLTQARYDQIATVAATYRIPVTLP